MFWGVLNNFLFKSYSWFCVICPKKVRLNLSRYQKHDLIFLLIKFKNFYLNELYIIYNNKIFIIFFFFINILTLIGIPPLTGFFIKLYSIYLFTSYKIFLLTYIIIIISIIIIYFYIKIIIPSIIFFNINLYNNILIKLKIILVGRKSIQTDRK